MTIQRIEIKEPSQVGEARRQAVLVAEGLGFNQTATGRVAIVISELATNILRYGAGGEVLLDRVETSHEPRVQVIALDRGAGISDIEQSLADGFSTSASAGTGLGAVKRQSAIFDIHSQVGKGTAVLSEISANLDADFRAVRSRVGGLAVPLAGETMCGDAWCVQRHDGELIVLLADGLGHGAAASKAAQTAIDVFLDNCDQPLNELAETIHLGLRATRGAAIGVLSLDDVLEEANFCGVGNVEASLVGSGRHRMISMPGTAGVSLRRIRVESSPTDRFRLAVMTTDGLSSKWSLEGYEDLIDHHPTLIAGVLYRDFTRGRDDTGVVVVKLGAQ